MSKSKKQNYFLNILKLQFLQDGNFGALNKGKTTEIWLNNLEVEIPYQEPKSRKGGLEV